MTDASMTDTDHTTSNVDPTLHPAWKQAVVEFRKAGFTYGNVVPLQWLYDAVLVEKPRPDTPMNVAAERNLAFGQQFGHLRQTLLEDDLIDLQKAPESNDYVVVRPEDQVPRAHKEGMHELRQAAKKAVKRMTFVSADQLTDAQRARGADLLAHFTQVRAVIIKRPKLTMREMNQLPVTQG